MCVFQTHPLIPTQRSDMVAAVWGSYLMKKKEKTDKPITLEKESKMPFFLTMSEITV